SGPPGYKGSPLFLPPLPMIEPIGADLGDLALLDEHHLIVEPFGPLFVSLPFKLAAVEPANDALAAKIMNLEIGLVNLCNLWMDGLARFLCESRLRGGLRAIPSRLRSHPNERARCDSGRLCPALRVEAIPRFALVLPSE